MSVDFKMIGERIKIRRKSLKKTQEALASELFVSAGYISQIERGNTKINLETLSEIADFLQCDMIEFLSDSKKTYEDPLRNKIDILYNQLSIEERTLLYELLLTYCKKK